MGLEASKEIEAEAFGELAVSPVARRLMDLFFATTALKKDNGVDDASGRSRARSKKSSSGRRGSWAAGIAYVTSVHRRHATCA